MERIDLDHYSIFLGPDVWQSLRRRIEEWAPSETVVLCDAHTRIYCLPELMDHLGLSEDRVISVPAGEVNKTLDTCRTIWQQMIDRKLDRDALLMNLGGGVIGDMGGFCAATYKRGIRFVQVPTTLLSQVDASIGGKLGIDFGKVKNSIGLFGDPLGVFIHTGFLSTLPGRELRSGFAEMIKHALIARRDQWEELRHWRDLEISRLDKIIPASIEVKKAIVREDPLERGRRKLLNFGHTIGHAVESFFLDGPTPFLHGEAIAIGMVCEAYLSHRLLGFSAEALGDLCALVQRVYGTSHLPEEHFPRLLSLMENDKKNRLGKISFSLLEAPGQAVWDQFCPEEMIRESLAFYNHQSLRLFTS